MNHLIQYHNHQTIKSVILIFLCLYYTRLIEGQGIEYGVVTLASGLAENSNMAVSNDGIVYFGEILANNHLIRSLNLTSKQISYISGQVGGCSNVDGNVTVARFCNARGMTLDQDGNLVIAHSDFQIIRKVFRNGTAVTIAGLISTSDLVDGTGSSARFKTPWGIHFNSDGNFYISSFNSIRLMNSNYTVTTIAGSGRECAGDDGQGTSASICNSAGIVKHPNGNIYFAEHTGTIRMINRTGFVTTVSGKMNQQSFSDGPASSARFAYPRELAVDRNGNIVIAGGADHSIRLLNLTDMTVSTIAGLGGTSGNSIGEAKQARFNTPVAVWVNQTSGNIIVSDFGNKMIKMIIPCLPIQKWDITSELCLCPVGSFLNISRSSCQSCMTNATCSTNTFSCHPGFEFDQNTSQCVSCAPGNIKSVSGNQACVKCPVGQEPAPDKRSCVSCGQGKFKPSNIGFTECVSCPVGASCTNTSISCLSGYSVDNNSLYTCKLCSPGTVKLESGNQNCTACPPASYSNMNRTQCIPCSLGSEVNPFQTGCTLCSPGFYRDNTTAACMSCPVGTISSSPGSLQCLSCPIGTESSSNGTECKQCPSGKFRPSVNDFAICIDCPQGARCNSTSLTCLAGYTASTNKSFSCQSCPQDFYKPQEGDGECLKCLGGTYSSDDYTSCLNCAMGDFLSPVTGNCTQCEIGTEPNSLRTGCITCPSGFTKPNNFEFKRCQPCWTGSICTPFNFTCTPGFQLNGRKNGCSKCLSGSKKSIVGNNSCELCPVGTQSNSQRTECETCPHGYYRSNMNHPFCTPCLNEGVASCSATGFECQHGWEKSQDETICSPVISRPVVVVDQQTTIQSLTITSIVEFANSNSNNNNMAMIILATSGSVALVVIIAIGATVALVIYRRNVADIGSRTNYRKNKNGIEVFSDDVVDLITDQTQTTDCSYVQDKEAP